MPEHAMARDYDCKMILMIRHTNGAGGAGFAEFPRDVAITPRFAIWNFQQLMPDSDLKWTSGKIERKLEVPSLAVEVFIDLLDKNPVRFVVDDAVGWYVVSKVHRSQSL